MAISFQPVTEVGTSVNRYTKRHERTQIWGLGVLERGLDRITVGVGMIPRGEVGLIFAGIGRSLNIIDDGVFSAIVIIVMLTTLITPPLLKYTMAR